MRIGDVVRFDRYRETIKRGDDFCLEFSINLDDSDGCSAPVKGAPLNGTGFVTAAAARVVGTNAVLPIVNVITRQGSDTEPMQIFVRVDRANIPLVFDEGALEAFTFQVMIAQPQNTSTVLCGEVRVQDTASGGGTG